MVSRDPTAAALPLTGLAGGCWVSRVGGGVVLPLWEMTQGAKVRDEHHVIGQRPGVGWI